MIDHKYFKEFDPAELLYCNIAVGVIGAAAVGAAGTAYAASKAADAQTAAADKAQQTQMNMYNTTRGDLAPFRDMGVSAAGQLTSRLADLTAPIVMDQATLEKTPGYQFNQFQGLKSTQNSAAARGLGSSGAALKGAAAFATGLADNTYQNQFNNAVTNQTNAFNRLKSLVDTGENAAAQTGVLGEKAAYNSGQAQIGAGNAQAAGYNAAGTAVNNFANSAGGYMAYKGLYGGGSGTASTINYGGQSWPAFT
jgi:hypothetical protein